MMKLFSICIIFLSIGMQSTARARSEHVHLERELQGLTEMTAGGTKYNGGYDVASWNEGEAPSDKLGIQSFNFEVIGYGRRPARRVRQIALGYTRNDATVNFHDSNSTEDDFSWSTRALTLPPGTTMHHAEGRSFGADCDWSGPLDIPSDEVFVLSGFDVEWSRNIDKQLGNLEILFHTLGNDSFFTVCYTNEETGDREHDFVWSVDYALVPADMVDYQGETGVLQVDPENPGTNEMHHIDYVPPDGQLVLRGFEFKSIEPGYNGRLVADQRLLQLHLDLDSSGTIRAKLRGEQRYDYQWSAQWVIVKGS